MRTVSMIALVLIGATAVAAVSLWRGAERLGGTVEWMSSLRPAETARTPAARVDRPAVAATSHDEIAVAPAVQTGSPPSVAPAPSAARGEYAELVERLEQDRASGAYNDLGLEATMRLLLEDPNPEVREEAAKFLELWLSQSQEATAVE